ncbi:hypothetical protein [Streptomyces mayonensis]|uniref:hypothetical protein n=1 Tax=Streptomyces mayonensis TaxID=2750816 RepID=UPI001C1E2AD3|nr:hypothetical protein [Streptomyces sp. A108]MBU6530737.1 hypothetical protein [Streptomyces sp. A108]
MDVDAAQTAIRRQNRIAQERLAPIFRDVAVEGDALAQAIAPWLGRCWRRTVRTWLEPDGLGQLKEGARGPVKAAARWARESSPGHHSSARATTSWGKVWKAVDGLSYHPPTIRDALNARYGIGAYEDADDADNKSRRHLESAVQSLHDLIKETGQLLRRPPGELLVVPEKTRPPRHAQLAQGRLGRLAAEDLADLVAKGMDLEQSLSTGRADWPEALAWTQEADAVLRSSLQGVRLDGDAERSIKACRSPLVADPRRLARASTVFVLSYLREVQARMPDYIEASGQQAPEPQVSMTFSGGTFIGGQFAARISNIHSTVAGIHQEGHVDVAEALRALQQAVVADNMDDNRRSDLLDNVEYLAQAAAAPAGERNRGLARAAMGALTAAATGGSALSQALESWGSVLHRLFG